VEELFSVARELGVDVVGISFHVGSGCTLSSAYTDAVKLARRAWNIGTKMGFNLTLLDVGGGFPGSDAWKVKFDEASSVLNRALMEQFGKEIENDKITVIAEPGRFFSERAFTLAVNIIARRRCIINDCAESKEGYMYYVNDGVYGSFNCTIYDHAICHPKVLRKDREQVPLEKDLGSDDLFECSVWGPTCDGLDRINEKVFLPRLAVGDWMVYERMGAYTVCAASQFNGFRKSNIVYTDSKGEVRALLL